jgi:hypothetical protein
MHAANPGGGELVTAVATPVAQECFDETIDPSDVTIFVGSSSSVPEMTEESSAYPIAHSIPQCRQVTSAPRQGPIPLDPQHLNEHIDRVASFMKQKRHERAAAGEIVVEESSSIGIDLDRIDAFFFMLAGRHGRLVGSIASRRMMSRFTNYIIFGIVLVPTMIIALPTVLSADSMSFPWNLAMWMGIVQPLGIGGLYWTNQLRDGMLPRRHTSGTIRVLLTGAWFFRDSVITSDQALALLAVQVGQSHSTMVLLLPSLMAPLTLDLLSDDNGFLFFLFMVLFSLPGVLWYRLIRWLHKAHFENGPNRATYNPLPAQSGANQTESLRDLECVMDESIAVSSATTANTERPARADADQSERPSALELV